jgi:recombination DNA repair RAD52 pathway protein
VTLRLTVFGIGPDGQDVTYTEAAAGSSRGHVDWDMAVKTAETDALKRAAINLGDQFGLSLYNNGSLRPIIIRTLDQETDSE